MRLGISAMRSGSAASSAGTSTATGESEGAREWWAGLNDVSLKCVPCASAVGNVPRRKIFERSCHKPEARTIGHLVNSRCVERPLQCADEQIQTRFRNTGDAV